MKKRIVPLALALLLLISPVLSCTAPDGTTVTDGQGNVMEREDIAHLEHYFIGEVQYYQTNLFSDVYWDEPCIHSLCTPDEAAEFAVENDLILPLSHYNDAFFKKKDLLAVRMECSSGGSRYELARLARTENGRLQMDMSLIVDGDTTDMGAWLILIPVDKGSITRGMGVTYRELSPSLSQKLNSATAPSDVRYFREGVAGDYNTPLQTATFSTKAELDDYRISLGLEEAYGEYDEAFFAEGNRIVLVSLPVSTAPADYALNGLILEDDGATLIIDLCKIYGKDATTQWQLLQFAIPLSADIPDYEDLDVYLRHESTAPENATPLAPVVLATMEDDHCHYLTSHGAVDRFCAWFLSPYAEDSRAYYASLDDAYFETHDLLVVSDEGGSSSIGYEVLDIIEEEDGSVTVEILTLNPTGAVTDDVTPTQIVIPVKKGLLGHSDSLYTQKVNVKHIPVSVSHVGVR